MSDFPSAGPGGGAAPGGAVTYQDVYNDSAPPNTTTTAAKGAVQYQRGSALDTDAVYQILNGAGMVVATITGNGVIVADGSGITNFGINDLKDAKQDTDDSSSLFLGTGAGINDDGTTRNNVGVGKNALTANISGIFNVAIGVDALLSATTASFCTAIGFEALSKVLTNTRGTAVGARTLKNATGVNNTGFGSSALEKTTTGASNVAVGENAAAENITGIRNTIVGCSALRQNTGGNGNVAIGYLAATGALASSIFRNIAIGSMAGQVLATGGDENILIGDATGNTITSGARNILIGTALNPPTATTDDHLNIGDIITADLATQAVTFPGSITTPTYLGLPNNTLFISNADVIVANTTAATSLVGTGTGSATIPAVTLKLGTKIEIKLQGIHSTTANPTADFSVALGGVTIGSTGAQTLSNTTNSHWDLALEFVVRSIGITGTVMPTGKYTNASNDHFGLVNLAPVTIDTTVAQTVDITIQYGTASASNTATAQILEIEELNV